MKADPDFEGFVLSTQQIYVSMLLVQIEAFLPHLSLLADIFFTFIFPTSYFLFSGQKFYQYFVFIPITVVPWIIFLYDNTTHIYLTAFLPFSVITSLFFTIQILFSKQKSTFSVFIIMNNLILSSFQKLQPFNNNAPICLQEMFPIKKRNELAKIVDLNQFVFILVQELYIHQYLIYIVFILCSLLKRVINGLRSQKEEGQKNAEEITK